MYNPKIPPIYEVGYIPHYIDKVTFQQQYPNAHMIDIQTLNWKRFVRQVKQCRKIVSSSLHGVVIAEAYGIPVEWVKYSDDVIGGEFKFRDYLTGTCRPEQSYGMFPKLDSSELKKVQDGLLKAIKDWNGGVVKIA